MKLVVAGAPLPGLRAREVTDAVVAAWRRVRPGDQIAAVPVSDGVAEPYVGSGLDETLIPDARQCRRGRASESRFAYCGPGEILMDYTDVLDGLPGDHALSSRIVGLDLAWAAEQHNVSQIYVALPGAGCVSDGGLALAEALADPDRQEGVFGVRGTAARPVEQRDVSEWFDHASKRLRHVSIAVLAPEEQRLVGLSGIAHTWMVRGMPATTAQTYEGQLGDIAEMIDHTGLALAPTFIGARPGVRGVFSGVGGIGLALNALGARINLTGDVVVRPRIAPLVDTTDLVVYICGVIGENLPSGLATAVSEAARCGVAVVVIYQTGSLRRGELPRLGIHGAYELVPGFTAADTPHLHARLIDVAERVATTWGWD